MASIISEPDVLSIEDMKQMVVGCKMKVPLLDGSEGFYINFDNAASTPVLKPVLDSINEFMNWYSSIHRGTGFKSQLCSELYDYSRKVVGDFVNADAAHHAIIFGKNTTEAVNKLARRFTIQSGQIVLTSKMEHHSNDLPWRMVAPVEFVDIEEDGQLSMDDLMAKLDRHQGRIALFAITGASNVTGWINDIHKLAEIVHRRGIPIMVDAAQLAPHRKIDMRSPSDPGHIDFLAFSAHKMYAPFGAGVLIGDKKIFEQGDPDLVGGGTIDIVALDHVHWAEVPEKDEAGSPNVVGTVTLAKVLLVLQEIGMENIAAHEARLTAYALHQMKGIRDIEIYGNADPERLENRLGVITFNIKGLQNELVAAILNYEYGIGVRNGCFCAHPYIKKLMNVSEEESRRMEEAILRRDRTNIPGAIRVSFGIYNDEAEIDILISALRNIANRKWKGDYVQNKETGEFHPRNFKIEYRKYFWI